MITQNLALLLILTLLIIVFFSVFLMFATNNGEREKITPESLKKLGFRQIGHLFHDSYELVINDLHLPADGMGGELWHFRAVSVSLCNDRGKGEYYLFYREGETNKREEDVISGITRNLEYIDDLKPFIRLLKL